jgi:hypothetical protein
MATGFISAFQPSHPELHDAYKMVLLREMFRMTKESRRELDKRYEEVLRPLLKNEINYQIATHVRRTDKITGEARAVACSTFVQGIEHILQVRKKEIGNKKVILHLISDESQVENECLQAIQASDNVELKRIKIHFRFAKDRPDRVRTLALADESFWRLLIDLRLMIESDDFLGSQSS